MKNNESTSKIKTDSKIRFAQMTIQYVKFIPKHDFAPIMQAI